jgi:hypothetical protein
MYVCNLAGHVPAGLLDGIFSNHKSKFGEILEGLALRDVGIFYSVWYVAFNINLAILCSRAAAPRAWPTSGETFATCHVIQVRS